MTEIILEILTAGCLVKESISDLRYKEISVTGTGAVLTAGILLKTIFEMKNGMLPAVILSETVTGCVPGAFLLAASLASKGAIGRGDGIILLMIGALWEWRTAAAVVMTALMMVFPVSVILLIISGRGRKTSIPFVPFLTAAWMCIQWMT